MALVIHISVALILYFLRSRFGHLRSSSKPVSGRRMVNIYLANLVTIVILPYLFSEGVGRLLAVPHQLPSLVLLLPHFYMLVIQKQILGFVQQTLKGKK